MGGKLTGSMQMDTRFMFMKLFVPRWLSAPARGYLHVYDHDIQTSSLKPLCQSDPNFMWRIVRKVGMKVCVNGQGHMTKMAAMAINSKKNFKNLLQNQNACEFETWHETSGNEAL